MDQFEDQEPQKPRAMYEEVQLYVDPQQWNKDKDIRTQRLENVVGMLIGRQYDDLDQDGRNFVDNIIPALRTICQQDYEELRTHLPEIILLSVDEEGTKLYEIRSENLVAEDFPDHNDSTLKAADVVLKALTPELQLGIETTIDEALELAQKLKEKGLAQEIVNGEMIYFSTVIPGVVVNFNELDISPGKSISISAIKDDPLP